MSVKRIASRYAKSLLDLSVEQGNIERVKEDVDALKSALGNRDFELLLKSPIIAGSKKKKVVDAIFGDRLDKLSNAFIDIIIRKGRETYLPSIVDEFLLQYKKYKHISSVKITTAEQLDGASLAAIKKSLQESVQTDDNIEIATEVNPDLIGGFVLEFGDKLYDASVRHKLDLLSKEFDKNLYVRDF